MKKRIILTTLFLCLMLVFSACKESTVPVETQPSSETTVDTQPTEKTTQPTETEPAHSPLYIQGLDVEDVIQYFNEVCLDAEIVTGGDATVLQKWTSPIYYMLNGNPTKEDLLVLFDFVAWLNTIEGFPGMQQSHILGEANLQIHFCTQQKLLDIMGDDYTYVDGAVTFWYENNAIYDATICYRTDLHQNLRNSVILEEIYNGLGPIQDTVLRPDSIIYSEFSTPQALTAVDELILRLLYHPQMLPGMNADECEAVIRQLYY